MFLVARFVSSCAFEMVNFAINSSITFWFSFDILAILERTLLCGEEGNRSEVGYLKIFSRAKIGVSVAKGRIYVARRPRTNAF
jgi:hypothetical protein